MDTPTSISEIPFQPKDAQKFENYSRINLCLLRVTDHLLNNLLEKIMIDKKEASETYYEALTTWIVLKETSKSPETVNLKKYLGNISPHMIDKIKSSTASNNFDVTLKYKLIAFFGELDGLKFPKSKDKIDINTFEGLVTKIKDVCRNKGSHLNFDSLMREYGDKEDWDEYFELFRKLIFSLKLKYSQYKDEYEEMDATINRWEDWCLYGDSYNRETTGPRGFG